MVFTAQQALAGAERDLPRSLARCWLDQDESILPFSRTKTFWQMKKGMEEIWAAQDVEELVTSANGRKGDRVQVCRAHQNDPFFAKIASVHGVLVRKATPPPSRKWRAARPTPLTESRLRAVSADRAACAARTGASASGGPTSPEAARARAPRPRTPATPRAARGAGRRRGRFSRAQPLACT